jgi:glycosyltransferase involved in cell wall biosynthesis
MKLLYITNGINGAGGLERVLSIKASYLANNLGYEVHILSLNNGDTNPFYEFSTKIHFHDIKVKGNFINYFFTYLTGIKKVVKKINPNVILVCDDGLKGFFLPILLGKPCSMVYERHVSKNIEFRSQMNWFQRRIVHFKWFLMNNLATKFDRFVVLTEGNTKEWNLKNLEVIPNPLSFYPNESSSLEHKKVIAIGKQSYQKGYDLLLQTWKQVHTIHPNWILEIYGKWDANQNLESLSNSLNLGESVRFFEPVKDIEKHLLESSIFVLSSRFEGFGMVLIEAMACGVPCVSFDCPYGPSDIIRDGEDGILVPNGDFTQLADSLKLLMDSEFKRTSMGKLAKENVKRYLPETVCEQWNLLFKSLEV